MKINSYTKEDVAILQPVGKLMGGPDVGELDERLYALLEEGQTKVVIDFNKTAWISSSAIAILIHHRSKFPEAGGYLRLANLSQKVQEIMNLSNLTSVFEIYDTLEAALSFKG